MDWGGNITYFGQTSLKGQTVRFGIKDADRLEHVSIIGKTGSGRAALLATMALQDIERGIGTVVLDAVGNFTEVLLERLSENARKRLIYLDPSDAEYPFSWNPLDDFRKLPKEKALPLLLDLVSALYRAPASPLIAFAVERMLSEKNATLLLPYELVRETVFREKMLPKETSERAEFEALLVSEKDSAELISQNGRYLAKDTLVRNLLGQQTSKFTLDALNEGGVIVLDLSRIRMFPTRITPLVRLFAYAARARATEAVVPYAIYMQDCLRCIAQIDIERIFPERRLAFTMSDSIHTEDDARLREKAFARSGSIIAFSPNVADVPLVEKIFFPFIGQEDFSKLETEEIAVALSIDAVRSRPFFARAVKIPDRKNVSYHDIQVAAREQYSSSRSQIDQLFLRKYAPTALKGKDSDPGSFSDAFRSIFTKRAGDAGSPAQTPSSGPPPPQPSASAKVAPKADANRKSPEVSEEELRQMLYVDPVRNYGS